MRPLTGEELYNALSSATNLENALQKAGLPNVGRGQDADSGRLRLPLLHRRGGGAAGRLRGIDSAGAAVLERAAGQSRLGGGAGDDAGRHPRLPRRRRAQGRGALPAHAVAHADGGGDGALGRVRQCAARGGRGEQGAGSAQLHAARAPREAARRRRIRVGAIDRAARKLDPSEPTAKQQAYEDIFWALLELERVHLPALAAARSMSMKRREFIVGLSGFAGLGRARRRCRARARARRQRRRRRRAQGLHPLVAQRRAEPPRHLGSRSRAPSPAGKFKAIPTRVDGLQLSEHLPHVADVAQHLAVLRGMTSKEGNHDRAQHLVHTGYAPNPTVSLSVARRLGGARGRRSGGGPADVRQHQRAEHLGRLSRRAVQPVHRAEREAAAAEHRLRRRA